MSSAARCKYHFAGRRQHVASALAGATSELEARTGAALTLQHLVDEWECSQAGLHGMTRAPEALLVQINRFEVSPEGTLKVATSIQPDPYLMIPTFLHDLGHAAPLALQYRRYCRVAAILHLGDSPHAGHYRAILYGDILGDFITDDNQCAALLSPDQALRYQPQLYAFLYKLCDVH